jgi:hypothetical protein
MRAHHEPSSIAAAINDKSMPADKTYVNTPKESFWFSTMAALTPVRNT